MASLRASISGDEHDRDNRERALETMGVPYIAQNFMNVGPLTAKNRTTENSAFFVIVGLRTRRSADRTQPNFGVNHGNKIFGPSTPQYFGAQKPVVDDFTTQCQIWGPISPMRNTTVTIGKERWKLRGVPYVVPKLKFRPPTAKIGPSFSHTLRNHHLLGRGSHHVGLPLRAPTFLVIL